MIHHVVSFSTSILRYFVETSNGKFGFFSSPTDRTAELRKLGFPTRHLGPMQMTTDTALGVTKIVVQDLSTF